MISAKKYFSAALAVAILSGSAVALAAQEPNAAAESASAPVAVQSSAASANTPTDKAAAPTGATPPTAEAAQPGTEQAAPAEANLGMPNPIVKYDNITKLNNVLGFRPLYVPRIYGYECTSMYIIAGDLAQLSFKSNIDTAELIVRTARREAVGTDEISGYYGVNWTEKVISRTKTLYGTATNGNTVVSWVSGKYAFSVSMKGLDEPTFLRQMKGLVRTSEQRYNRRPRQKK